MKAYSRKEMEQLFMMAAYSDEIARRKLASQLVLTLGEECGKEKIVHILSGNYRDATVCREQLEHGTVECNSFYVMGEDDRILVAVPEENKELAEVYADYGSADGTLAVGKEAYHTIDDIVYELDVPDAEKVHIIVYLNPLNRAEERIAKKGVSV